MTRVILAGAAGRMGKVMRALAEETAGVKITALIAPSLGTSFAACEADADVVIDFSTPAALQEELSFCVQKGMGLVLAATGHPEEARAWIGEAAERIAVFQSANLSYGVYALVKLATHARGLLGEPYDVTVVETHHRAKKDAPSGTAKLLAAAMETPDAPMVSIRGGSVIGVHEIDFYGEHDVITLRHEALDRRVFAQGALTAAQWIATCAPGLYGMEDFIASFQTSKR